MITVKQHDEYIELIDSDGYNLYEIPTDRLQEEYSEFGNCSDWISHLSNKIYTTEQSKNYLYELAVIIEKKHPNLFDWKKTFEIAELDIFNNIVFSHQNKKHEDEFGVLNFKDIEVDADQFSDPQAKSQISEAVKGNLARYRLL